MAESLERSPDVLIIGGGVIGTLSAIDLAGRGFSTVVLERDDSLVASASAGNAGLIVPSHSAPLASPRAVKVGLKWMFKTDSPFYFRPRPRIVPWLLRFVTSSTPRRAHRNLTVMRSLCLESLEMHDALVASGLDTGFKRNGVLNVYETVAGYEEGMNEAHNHSENGLIAKPLAADEARRVCPALSERVVGAIVYPGEGHCDPHLFMAAIRDRARKEGVPVLTGVEAFSVNVEEARVRSVSTTVGRFHPKTVVLAAGAWSAALSRSLGVKLPIEGAKGYHVEIGSSGVELNMPVFMQEARVVACPVDRGIRLAGTLELSGLDMQVNEPRVEAIARAGRRMLIGLASGTTSAVWRGFRPCAPDGLPIIGRSRRVDNVIFATAHAMLGLTLAPLTARLVGQMIAGETTDFDCRPFHPDRFLLLARR